MSSWWNQLGLRFDVRSPLSPPPENRALVLARLVPVGFDSPDGRITLEEAAQRLDAAQAEVERAREFEEAARRAHGWAQIEAAYEAPDADVVVVGGVWEGFTHARARAWLWNFVQYIPRAGGLRYTADRERAQEILEEGNLLDLEGFAELARELEADGSNPHAYRRAMETLGRDTFDETSVLLRF